MIPTGCTSDACTDALKAGNVVRNNLFVQLGATNGLVMTPFRAANDLPALRAQEVNDGDAWFGPFANDVGGNRTASALVDVFDSSVTGPLGPIEWDATWRSNHGHVFHFASFFDGTFGTELSAYGVPLGPTLDQSPPNPTAVGPS